MRFFAFLFLAAFLVSGLIRYSRAQTPPLAPAPPPPAAAAAELQPAPQVLRHKRRYAKAALRAIQKAPAREPPLPPRRMAKTIKPSKR
jgi:hypothetical protein